jgi:hypothetical protein
VIVTHCFYYEGVGRIFTFDRLHATKLEQVFAILVPNQERRIDESTVLRVESHENSRDLHPCLPSARLRQASDQPKEEKT